MAARFKLVGDVFEVVRVMKEEDIIERIDDPVITARMYQFITMLKEAGLVTKENEEREFVMCGVAVSFRGLPA